jgi:hypothetical protein
LWILGGIAVGLVFLATLGITVVYPKVGAWMIRSRVGDKLEQKLGRDVHFGAIDVSLGRAILHNLELRGPLDGDTPLVHVDRIEVEFDAWASLTGHIELGEMKVDGVICSLRREADGRDNVRDVIDRLRGAGGRSAELSSNFGSLRPTNITVNHIRLLADDELTGTTVLWSDGDASWTPELAVAHVKNLTASTTAAPKATVNTIEIRKARGEAPGVDVEGGELELWPKMALSGIGGKVVADPAHPGQYTIDLAGGYGGVPGRLWTARGGFDPTGGTARLDLEAVKFQLDRLAPILEHSAVVDYTGTSVDTALHVEADRQGARFSGGFHLAGLNVGHPYIAEKEVRDLDLSGDIAGTFDRTSRKLELTRGDFLARNVRFSLTGSVTRGQRPVRAEAPRKDVANVPFMPLPGLIATLAALGNIDGRLVIPPIDCQRFLDAIPKEMAPYMAGYKLRGVFHAYIELGIDWADLDATKLDSNLLAAINRCKVLDEPADSPKRLKDEFDQFVENDKGEWESFVVGPTNTDFVPLDQISPYVIKSIMSTEDTAFYKHRGFIPEEFRTALINNLKQGKFVQGASSITMQMVKNVLLYREKTLARKLQELFLTWHVENTLDKDRIMEIYLNVIEFGPGLYGIGPAAWHYFGKTAKDLNPVEAAFFSSILPGPKERYKQYCAGTLTRWTTGKIERILDVMRKRDRLTQEEYDKARATPLSFIKDGSETEEECLKRVKKAIKNARPTNPLAPKEDPKPKEEVIKRTKRPKRTAP